MTTPNPKHYDQTAETDRFTGLFPDNDYPLVDGELDEVQEMRKQARDEHDRTRRVASNAPRPAHPPFTERYTTNDHATRSAEAEAVTETPAE